MCASHCLPNRIIPVVPIVIYPKQLVRLKKCSLAISENMVKLSKKGGHHRGYAEAAISVLFRVCVCVRACVMHLHAKHNLSIKGCLVSRSSSFIASYIKTLALLALSLPSPRNRPTSPLTFLFFLFALLNERKSIPVLLFTVPKTKCISK